jgi:Dyp-type peroxidase family
MLESKYFDGVRKAQAGQTPVADLPPFDPSSMRSKASIGASVKALILDDPRWWLAILRRFWPIASLGGYTIITRDADVREALERQDIFTTPYGPEMSELAGGSNFILGLQDGKDYRRMKSAVLSAFPPHEVEQRVRPIASGHAQAIVARASPGFDAIGGLLKIVPARICRDYFGMAFDDEQEFTDWSIALSAMFFSDPGADPTVRRLARIAANRMIACVDRSIEAVRDGSTPADRPLARLVRLMDDGAIELPEVHSIMLGMISGFAPTNILAGGNCLDFILSSPQAQAAVGKAVADNDIPALDRAIREAMRFKPIWIGPWRYASSDIVIAQGTRRERLIKRGQTVIPSTLSAMFDPDAIERPNEFDPLRPDHTYMVYGHGLHVCIGAEVARVQIGECLRALFMKKALRRAAGRTGKLTRLGAYPETLRVEFDREPLSRTVEHAMVTIVCPVRTGADLDRIEEMISALDNPASDPIRRALDATGIVHFASVALAPTCTDDKGRPESAVLMIEFSADGSADDAITAFAASTEVFLGPIFDIACDRTGAQSFEAYLKAKSVAISPSFGSNNGLVFSGTPGHSVQRIRAEAELADMAAAIVERPRAAVDRNAASVLAEARQETGANPRFDWAMQSAENKLDANAGSIWQAIYVTLKAPAVMITTLLVLAVVWTLTYMQVFGYAPGVLRNLLVLGTSLLLTVLGISATVLAAGGAFGLALRQLERGDTSNAATIEIDRLEQILAREDRSAQNHLTAISVMKPGILRRVALRLTFYLISISARHVFRPGFLSNISTIHFARWVLLPGSNRLMFFSNYGGSWESYLEDFVTKASAGLTGVWSNTAGFTPTRWLFSDGARDGDRFKRWARRQQTPTLFWYSAYPELNTQRIRTNSQIRAGICSASDSEARDWLSLFGSRPRPRIEREPERLPAHASSTASPEQIETGEIQSIFFNAFGPLNYGHLLAVAIPPDLPRKQRKRWLGYLVARTSFGDQIPRDRAMTVGIGATGLRRFGLEKSGDHDPLAYFPNAFRHGLGNAARSRILGDVGALAPDHWRWGSDKQPVDMVVFCYAAQPRQLKADIAALRREAAAAGVTITAELPLEVRREGKRAVEHFGFADGVSQPIVRGTARANAGASAMNLVAAGEFLFGYRDEYGFYPVSPCVKAAHDPTGILAPVDQAPDANGTSGRMHDIGRNGSFLVVRQFEQHVEEFDAYCGQVAAQKAQQLNDPSVTPEWVAAKMMGRWKDGSSLVRNPEHRPGRPADNDFSFGIEDPQGLRCPFGAHVRRTNPRDSLGDDHATQMAIGKRHRILRVGRTYELPARGRSPAEKGLLFMCLNADIERQYEFIQQTWVSSTSFHGLTRQKDPVIGASDGSGRFTIPFWEGSMVLEGMPRFVTTRGGGYFFMPSRAALRFLVSRL